MLTNMGGGKHYTTISMIIPCVLELAAHLDEVEEASSVDKILSDELESFCLSYRSRASQSHPNIHGGHTVIDPRYKIGTG